MLVARIPILLSRERGHWPAHVMGAMGTVMATDHQLWIGASMVFVSADFFTSVTLSLSPGAVLKENEPFRLTCDTQVSERESQKPGNSSGRPQVIYTFYKNGQAFASSSPRAMVAVTQAQRCHSGRYSCTVASGRAQRSSPELHVTTDGTQ